MNSKQTRRSVSISGELYDKLKAYCTSKGESMSGMVEVLTRAHLDMAPRDTPKVAEKPPVEVVRTVAVAPVHPEAKPANGTKVPEPTYGLSKADLEARKEKLVKAHRRAGNIFTF